MRTFTEKEIDEIMEDAIKDEDKNNDLSLELSDLEQKFNVFLHNARVHNKIESLTQLSSVIKSINSYLTEFNLTISDFEQFNNKSQEGTFYNRKDKDSSFWNFKIPKPEKEFKERFQTVDSSFKEAFDFIKEQGLSLSAKSAEMAKDSLNQCGVNISDIVRKSDEALDEFLLKELGEDKYNSLYSDLKSYNEKTESKSTGYQTFEEAMKDINSGSKPTSKEEMEALMDALDIQEIMTMIKKKLPDLTEIFEKLKPEVQNVIDSFDKEEFDKEIKSYANEVHETIKGYNEFLNDIESINLFTGEIIRKKK